MTLLNDEKTYPPPVSALDDATRDAWWVGLGVVVIKLAGACLIAMVVISAGLWFGALLRGGV